MSTPPPNDSSSDFACLLYKQHRRDLLSFLKARGVQERDLEDALQDVIKGACDSRHTRNEGNSFEGWLFGIAANVVGHYLRSPYRREELATSDEGGLDTMPDVSPGAEDLLIQRDRLRMLDQMVASMKEERRGIFVQHKREDIPLAEVARVNGIAVKTAWMRCKAAFDECAGWFRRWQIAERRKGREGEAILLPLRSVEPGARHATARPALSPLRLALARGGVALFGLGCISPRAVPLTASEIRPLLAAAPSLTASPPSTPAEHAAAYMISPGSPACAAPATPFASPLPERRAPEGADTLDSELMILQADIEQHVENYDEAAGVLLEHDDRFPDGSMSEKRCNMFNALARSARSAGR